MRAKFISEKFTEEGDPIRDMNIGIIEAPRSISELKKLTEKELDEIYELLKKFGDNARIKVDDTMYSDLTVWEKRFFRNDVVRASNYKTRIKARDESRGLNLKVGDAIKCEIRGVIYMGYAMFSKRGILKTDNNGRIAAKTLKGIMKVPARYAERLSPKEQKDFDKLFFKETKEKLERLMAMYKKYSPINYERHKEEYDKLIKDGKYIPVG